MGEGTRGLNIFDMVEYKCGDKKINEVLPEQLQQCRSTTWNRKKG